MIPRPHEQGERYSYEVKRYITYSVQPLEPQFAEKTIAKQSPTLAVVSILFALFAFIVALLIIIPAIDYSRGIDMIFGCFLILILFLSSICYINYRYYR